MVCVNSLLAQGIEDDAFEIILVDDGSTDGSETLCMELSKKYSQITVLSQKNKGLSEARNSGIRAARGEYLCFVDADDSLIPGGIASLSSFCDGIHDVIRYWCSLVYPGAKEDIDLGDGRVLFSGKGIAYLRQFGLETFCWNYLYKRSFIEENNLYFTPGIIGEDFPYMFDVMMANPRVISVAKRLYQYNIIPGSQSNTRTPQHSRRRVTDLMGSLSKIVAELEPYRGSDPLLYEVCRRSLDYKTTALFSRILSSRYTTQEYREILSSCKTAGLLPLKNNPRLFVSILTRFPVLYPAASALYSRVFLPYIYPRINRYG